MPRIARLVAPGASYHLTARGTGGIAVFRRDGDRLRFLKLLERVVLRYRWNCLCYCLMTTHYHLVVQTPEDDLARGMHRLNACYAQSFNRFYERFGHLFAERFHSVLIRTDGHLLESIRYVVLNPVRAGICETPQEWPWSSYAATIGLTKAPPFLAVDALLRFFGRDAATATRRLRAFVEETSPAGHGDCPRSR
jgi:putative transposase